MATAKLKFKIFEGADLRDIYGDVQTADGLGTRREKVGSEEYEFVVEVDEKSLRHLGYLAARNLTGKAKRGGLVAKIVSRKPGN